MKSRSNITISGFVVLGGNSSGDSPLLAMMLLYRVRVVINIHGLESKGLGFHKIGVRFVLSNKTRFDRGSFNFQGIRSVTSTILKHKDINDNT